MSVRFEEEINFLKSKGMIEEDNKRITISGEFGNIDLAELLHKYALLYEEDHDQGEYGRVDY